MSRVILRRNWNKKSMACVLSFSLNARRTATKGYEDALIDVSDDYILYGPFEGMRDFYE